MDRRTIDQGGGPVNPLDRGTRAKTARAGSRRPDNRFRHPKRVSPTPPFGRAPGLTRILIGLSVADRTELSSGSGGAPQVRGLALLTDPLAGPSALEVVSAHQALALLRLVDPVGFGLGVLVAG